MPKLDPRLDCEFHECVPDLEQAIHTSLPLTIRSPGGTAFCLLLCWRGRLAPDVCWSAPRPFFVVTLISRHELPTRKAYAYERPPPNDASPAGQVVTQVLRPIARCSPEGGVLRTSLEPPNHRRTDGSN